MADKTAEEMAETVQVPRWWLQHVHTCRIGDVVFLLRDQIKDILERKP